LIKKLKLTSDINEAVAADYIIFAVPSAFLSDDRKLTVSLQDKVIFSAIKGIVPETTDCGRTFSL
jgi:glycerol-3-phosphate dehydrogenase (NAD(P)+)